MTIQANDLGLGPVEPEDVQDDALIFPCSASQNRCWFINALNPGNPALNVALRWEAEGRLSPSVTEQAFQQIVDRHEVLRSRFFEHRGEAMQEASPALDFKLSVVDLSMLPASEQEIEALRLGELEAHASFDLSQAPPIRVTYLKMSGERAILLVTVHQIAFDGWSIRILAHEFGEIAEAINARRPHALPPPPLQYGDYCRWQKAYLASGAFEEEIAYWSERLGDAPYFEVPSDHEKPARPTYKGVIIAKTLPPELGDGLEAAARRFNVTLFSLGCAMLGAALHRFTDENDVIFGTQIAGRDDPELENLIGMFINNLVMRFDASGDPTFSEFLRRANEATQGALINRRMPFDKLVETLNPPRDPSRTPLISVNFTVLRDVMDHKSYGDFTLHGRPSLSAGSLYDLIFFMVHWPDGWRMAMEYNPDLFEAETAENLLGFLIDTFEFGLRSPEAKLSGLAPPPRGNFEALARRAALRDLERMLEAQPSVAEAAVVQPVERARPYAFVAPQPGLRTPLEALPGRLAEALDAASPQGAPRPDGISVLVSLPKTRHGAIDRSRLPPPPPERSDRTPALTGAPASGPTATEKRLAAVWRELLQVETVEPQSNFFELGGHSLLSIRLMARVAAEFGVKLDPLTLFEAPTLRAFAARLPDGEAPAAVEEDDKSWLARIQPRGDKTPIISINNSMLYYTLAQKLGPDRPFVGISLVVPPGDEPPPDRSMSEIAADYVRRIKEAQPHGPYVLFGLCIGGALAYECAQQLSAEGEETPLLILADLWVPGYLASYPLHRKILYQLNYRARQLAHRVSLVLSGKSSFAEVLSSFTLVRKTRILDFAVSLGLVDGSKLARKVIGRKEWMFLMSLEHARDAYKIKPIGADVVILNSEEIVTTFADPKLGWGPLVKGRLSIFNLPGWHDEMFHEKGAEAAARHLRPLLEEIDRNRTTKALTNARSSASV
ncbi:condensation domain-containing protein [Methylocella sp.]|uniref:condensation domain-containing protein n=1 Tax=Methylocella sp. TaxID=1978226 RepID=UPI003783E7A4